MANNQREDEGISPVVGAILMVAITIVLAAVILFFVTDLANQPQVSAAGVEIEETAAGVDITLLDIGSADDLLITADGTTVATLTASETGAKTTLSGVSPSSQINIIARVDDSETVIRTFNPKQTHGQGAPITLNGDADSDSYTNSEELSFGSDPYDPSDTPPETGIPELTATKHLSINGDGTRIRALAIDNSGTIYVAAEKSSDEDFVAAYSQDGTKLWQYDWNEFGVDYLSAIEYGPDNNLYVGDEDGYIKKFDPSTGAIQWELSNGVIFNGRTQDIQADSAGNVYAMGGAKVISLDSTKTLRWKESIPQGIDADLTLTPDETTLVAATDRGYVRAYDTNGNPQWEYTHSNCSNSCYETITSDNNDVYALIERLSRDSHRLNITTGAVEDTLGTPGQTTAIELHNNKFYTTDPNHIRDEAQIIEYNLDGSINWKTDRMSEAYWAYELKEYNNNLYFGTHNGIYVFTIN
jgi:flagellin-like protein